MLSTAQWGRAMMARRSNNGMVVMVVRRMNEMASSSSSFPEAVVLSSTTSSPYTSWNTKSSMQVIRGDDGTTHHLSSRYFSNQPSPPPPVQQPHNDDEDEDDDPRKKDDHTTTTTTTTTIPGGENTDDILYEGPFAKLSLRLKRVSISTAVVSLVGIPLIVFLQNNAVPASGQIAVGGTALFAATGSTLALSYCFSPYVHTLKRVPDPSSSSSSSSSFWIQATTCNIIGRRVETVFDPKTDVSPSTGNRPFCNFEVKGKPMYIHPELLYHEELRRQLVGEVKSDNEEQQKAFDSKNKEDDFL